MQAEIVLTDKQLPADVVRAIKDGRKIEAIKMLQEAHGLGLANAKVLVDRASRVHGPKKKPNPFAVKESSGNGKMVVSLVAVGILAGAYYYYVGI